MKDFLNLLSTLGMCLNNNEHVQKVLENFMGTYTVRCHYQKIYENSVS
jgi:hypothetical protein